MSDTPETDANCWREGTSEWAAANFARKLERERDEARRLLAASKESLNAIHVEVGGWIAEMMKGGK